MFTGAEGGVYRPAAADDLLLQLLLMCELGANWEPNEWTVPLKPRGSRRKEPYGGDRNTRLADHTHLWALRCLYIPVHSRSNKAESRRLSSQTSKIYLLYLHQESLNVGASEEHLKATSTVLIWSDGRRKNHKVNWRIIKGSDAANSLLPTIPCTEKLSSIFLLVFILILLLNVPPLSPSVCITLSFLFFRLSIFFWSLYSPTVSVFVSQCISLFSAHRSRSALHQNFSRDS